MKDAKALLEIHGVHVQSGIYRSFVAKFLRHVRERTTAGDAEDGQISFSMLCAKNIEPLKRLPNYSRTRSLKARLPGWEENAARTRQPTSTQPPYSQALSLI